MTTDNNQTMEKKSVRINRSIPDGILNLVRSTPRHMPAGGWLTEAMTSENWRTTTIVRRYRDQAVQTLRSCSQTLPVSFRTTIHSPI